MRLLFSEVCSLLSQYEDIELRDPPFLRPAEKAAQLAYATESWFKSHRRYLNECSASSSVALLSTLLPERRTDRVYGIQAARLCRILSRALSLGSSRARDLLAYTRPGHGDLAVCVERVLRAGGPPAFPPVWLEEVDEMLQSLAGHSRFSGPAITKLPPNSAEERDQLLGRILVRLTPEEARWLVRLILKDLSPVRVDEPMVLKSFHFLLPDLLCFQNDFSAVMALLKGPLREYPEHPDPRSENLHRQSVARLLRPVVGIKVGRPNYHKARSIDHCVGLLGRRQCVLERKYDGEYCEIHIDRKASSIASDCIKIFSKSGKDSTRDRSGLHGALVEAFQLGTSESKIKRQAILLGELVVYSDKDNEIMPFEEIRKHVPRSGSLLGTKEDALPSPHEHLAIVLFDLLLLDDENVMARSVDERRLWLRKVYKKIPGRVMGAEWKIVDFEDQDTSRKRLMEQFAASISRRCEGLVLKPCGVTFFGLDSQDYGRHAFVKLKRDYMADLGDEADFAVIGASFNAQQALRSSVTRLKFTSFHLGCLTNKEEVLRLDSRAIFKFVGTISSDFCIPKVVLEAAHDVGNFTAKPFDRKISPSEFDLTDAQNLKMDVCFDTPFVFEVLGSGFEKPSDSNFLMLRHARVKKLHQDRTWRDCISFQELQQLAAESRARPIVSESQETLQWIEKLERKCKRKFAREQTTTPQSRTTTSSCITGTGPIEEPVVSSKIANEDPSLATSRRYKSNGNITRVITEYSSPEVSSGNCANKRSQQPSHQTPCPVRKKRRIETDANQVDIDIQNRVNARTPSPGAKILFDITGSATNSASPKHRDHDGQDDINNPSPNITISNASNLLPTMNANGQSNHCHHGDECMFMNATVYLAPCIATMPYIVDDLLPLHSITRVFNLTHWDRDAFAYETLTDTIAESQSNPGSRKSVFVESHRRSAVQSIVRDLLALNRGLFCERVEVYDWRALEGCVFHGTQSVMATRKKYFLGATMVDTERGRTIFVSNREWL